MVSGGALTCFSDEKDPLGFRDAGRVLAAEPPSEFLPHKVRVGLDVEEVFEHLLLLLKDTCFSCFLGGFSLGLGSSNCFFTLRLRGSLLL